MEKRYIMKYKSPIIAGGVITITAAKFCGYSLVTYATEGFIMMTTPHHITLVHDTQQVTEK